MNTEIRPARDTEMDEFKEVARRSLILSPDIIEAGINAIRPEWTLCAFEDDHLVTSYAFWPLKMRFNGKSCPVAGITFVGTNPVYRRKGHLRQIVSRHFEIMHERGEESIAALYASRASIYHRYGYAVSSWQNSYTVDPRHLAFVPRANDAGEPETNPGRFRDIGDDQTTVLKEIYRQFIKPRTGFIHRGDATWNAGVLAKPPETEVLFKIIYEENETPMGYVVYTITSGRSPAARPLQQLAIRDVAWLSPRAYQALWRYFANLDLVSEIKWMRVPPDDPLPNLVNEPGNLNIKTRDGLMTRIVDVAGALSQRDYHAEGSIRFELTDDICPWNNGKWLMEAAPDGVRVQRTTLEPEIRLPVDTLAMLLFGQLDATKAAEMGRLVACDPKAPANWNFLLQTRHKPFCPDFF